MILSLVGGTRDENNEFYRMIGFISTSVTSSLLITNNTELSLIYTIYSLLLHTY
jgi:hypothetical protein